eukprot:6546321-Prymnesium_polylepis.1
MLVASEVELGYYGESSIARNPCDAERRRHAAAQPCRASADAPLVELGELEICTFRADDGVPPSERSDRAAHADDGQVRVVG